MEVQARHRQERLEEGEAGVARANDHDARINLRRSLVARREELGKPWQKLAILNRNDQKWQIYQHVTKK